jgi:4-carboxymuconolactone decarboxylase
MTTRTPDRIRHLDPPYEADVESALTAMMPPGGQQEPLKLFRTFAHNLPMAEAMHGLGRYVLGRASSISLRDREIVIDRVCARCGAEYEWGVHVTYFGERAQLTDGQIRATVVGGADDPAWPERDRLLIRMVDELHDTSTVSDELWTELAAEWSEAQILDLLLLTGWYHAISYMANGARVELEDWAARFPAAR